MGLDIVERAGRAVHIRALGTLRADDDAGCVAPLTAALEDAAGDGLRVLLEVDACDGWHVAAFWRHLKLAVAHRASIERLAITGAKGWHRVLANALRALTSSEVRYYPRTRIGLARGWIWEGVRREADAARG